MIEYVNKVEDEMIKVFVLEIIEDVYVLFEVEIKFDIEGVCEKICVKYIEKCIVILYIEMLDYKLF